MPDTRKPLGKLNSVHGVSPSFLQRGAIVAILSFLFFLAMLVTFYIRQQVGYFVLASAFLVVYIFTMIGWWMQKRNVFRLYENGLTHRKFTVLWDEVESIVRTEKGDLEVRRHDGERLVIPSTIYGNEHIASVINRKSGHNLY